MKWAPENELARDFRNRFAAQQRGEAPPGRQRVVANFVREFEILRRQPPRDNAPREEEAEEEEVKPRKKRPPLAVAGDLLHKMGLGPEMRTALDKLA